MIRKSGNRFSEKIMLKQKARAVRDQIESVGIDRDRGTSRDAAPPTPPGIRVRTAAVRLS